MSHVSVVPSVFSGMCGEVMFPFSVFISFSILVLVLVFVSLDFNEP